MIRSHGSKSCAYGANRNKLVQDRALLLALLACPPQLAVGPGILPNFFLARHVGSHLRLVMRVKSDVQIGKVVYVLLDPILENPRMPGSIHITMVSEWDLLVFEMNPSYRRYPYTRKNRSSTLPRISLPDTPQKGSNAAMTVSYSWMIGTFASTAALYQLSNPGGGSLLYLLLYSMMASSRSWIIS